MSKYLNAYAVIYPEDASISWDKTDPRRKPTIAELQMINRAKTLDQAAALAERFGYADPGLGAGFAQRLAKELRPATQTGGSNE